jgi:hypothetical protein
MTSIPDFLGLVTPLVILGLIVAGVMKIFQVASDMQELKELLKDIRRNTQAFGQGMPAATQIASLGAAVSGAQFTGDGLPGLGLPGGGSPPTAEELVRAVHAQDFRGDEFPL